MSVRKTLRLFSLGNLLLIATGALIIYMGSSFVHQIGTHLQRQDELDQLEQRLEMARQEETQLQGELEYVQSPEAAEAWARENGWAKSDEVSVVVVAPPADLAQQEGDSLQGGDGPRSGPEVWWDLFFGER
jgi:cell division protein FtsB